VRAKKANASELPLKCRKPIDDVKTGVGSLLREEPGGYLLTAQVASGIKAARAWLRLLRGTCEPATSIPRRTASNSLVPERESLKQRRLREAEYRREAQGRTAP
jgi:plasmid stabilization system protein ParE